MTTLQQTLHPSRSRKTHESLQRVMYSLYAAHIVYHIVWSTATCKILFLKASVLGALLTTWLTHRSPSAHKRSRRKKERGKERKKTQSTNCFPQQPRFLLVSLMKHAAIIQIRSQLHLLPPNMKTTPHQPPWWQVDLVKTDTGIFLKKGLWISDDRKRKCRSSACNLGGINVYLSWIE